MAWLGYPRATTTVPAREAPTSSCWHLKDPWLLLNTPLSGLVLESHTLQKTVVDIFCDIPLEGLNVMLADLTDVQVTDHPAAVLRRRCPLESTDNVRLIP